MLRLLSSSLLLLLALQPLWPIEVAQDWFSWPTSTGSYNNLISGLSFAPKVIIFHYNESGVSGTVASGSSFGFGMATASPSYQMTIFVRASDGGAGNSDSSQRNDSIVHTIVSNSTTIARGSISSWNSDGVTIQVHSASNSVIARIGWLALGGSDLTNASIVQYTSPTEPGIQPLTGAGFAPTAAIIATLGSDTAVNSTRDNLDSWPGIGIATPTAQAASGYLSKHAAGGHRRSQSNSHVIYLPDEGDIRWAASVQSFDSDGITLYWSSVQTTAMFFWVLYLKGPSFGVVDFLQPTSTGDQAYSLTSFQPKAGLFITHCDIAATGQRTHGFLNVGTAVSPTARALHMTALSNSGSTIRYHRNDSVIACTAVPSGGTTSEVARADFVSWNSDGFTLYWSPVDSTQRQMLAILFGDGDVPIRRRGIVIH